MFPANLNESFHMKFCINCKHFSPAKDDPDHLYARCSHNQPISLVTGVHQRDTMSFCSVARIDGSGKCGKEAIHHEEKAVSHV
jgi:hypothetical protein